MEDSDKRHLAVFDFDHTLITSNSLKYLFRFAYGRNATRNPGYYVRIAGDGLAPKSVVQGYSAMKMAVKIGLYRRCLENKPLEVLAEAAEDVVKKLKLNEVAVKALRAHRQNGDVVAVATASPAAYVEHLLPALGLQVDHLIGTKLKVARKSKVLLTGELDGVECSMGEKWRRVSEFVAAELPNSYITSYGNLPDDLQLLEGSDKGFVVTGADMRLL